jgi:hypothetical protein
MLTKLVRAGVLAKSTPLIHSPLLFPSATEHKQATINSTTNQLPSCTTPVCHAFSPAHPRRLIAFLFFSLFTRVRDIQRHVGLVLGRTRQRRRWHKKALDLLDVLRAAQGRLGGIITAEIHARQHGEEESYRVDDGAVIARLRLGVAIPSVFYGHDGERNGLFAEHATKQHEVNNP